jgi:hypothetical protein
MSDEQNCRKERIMFMSGVTEEIKTACSAVKKYIALCDLHIYTKVIGSSNI